MAEPGLEPRRRAAAMMTAVTKDKLPLHTLEGELKGLEPSDRARAMRLASEALRWAPRSDKVLGPFLRNKPYDNVLNLFRLALYEINVDGVPPHAAVHAAVALAPKQTKGLINAVLRNVQRSETDWNSLPAPALPKWLRKRLNKAWGKEALAVMEVAHVMPAPLDLSCAKDAKRWAGELGDEVLPTGSVRLAKTGQD